jgi:hypothetical protein
MKFMTKAIIFFMLLLPTEAFAQFGNQPAIEYLGQLDNEEDWKLNCNEWKRTIRGLANQLPASTDRYAVQYLIEYVAAYSHVSPMEIKVYDVWVVKYPSYVVFIWFADLNDGKWTYRSMSLVTY